MSVDLLMTKALADAEVFTADDVRTAECQLIRTVCDELVREAGTIGRASPQLHQLLRTLEVDQLDALDLLAVAAVALARCKCRVETTQHSYSAYGASLCLRLASEVQKAAERRRELF